MPETDATVFLADDDLGVREAVAGLVRSARLDVQVLAILTRSARTCTSSLAERTNPATASRTPRSSSARNTVASVSGILDHADVSPIAFAIASSSASSSNGF